MEAKNNQPIRTQEGKEVDLALLMNKITRSIWGGLGIICLGGAIFAGAWWHLFTAGICYIMYSAFKTEEPENED